MDASVSGAIVGGSLFGDLGTMSSDKDTAGKGPSKGPADLSQPKKPSAVIDLKATEIPIKDGKPQAAGATSGSPAAGAPAAGSGSGSGKPTSTASAAGQAGAAKPAMPQSAGPASAGSAASPAGAAKPPAGGATAGGPGATKSQAGAPAAGSTASAQTDKGKPAGASAGKPDVKPDKPAAGAAAPAMASAKPAGRSTFVSMLTHATAGIVGGLIVLLAADSIGPQIGLPPTEAMQQGRALQSRLAEVEAKMSAQRSAPSGDPGMAQKLDAAERKLAALEAASADLTALRDRQAKLAAETQALAAKVGADAGSDAASANAAARLARLEEALALLSSAAGTDPQKGRIPQLATLTGKVTDLETALTTGLAGVRKSVTQEIDARLGTLTETAEAARSGVTRVDRDIGQVKADVNGVGKRLDETVQALRTDLSSTLAGVTRAEDLSKALAPVTAKIAALETSMQGVVKSETDRRADAGRVVLSLELGNLKRVVDRGAPYAKELEVVRRLGGDKLDLSALEPAKTTGLATTAELARDFRGLAHAIIEADRVPTDGSVVDRLAAGAKSIFRVRKTDVSADDKSSEATVARMDLALKSGQLQVVLDEAKTLSPQAVAPARAWLEKVALRQQIDRAIADVDDRLKASLASAAPAEKGVQ